MARDKFTAVKLIDDFGKNSRLNKFSIGGEIFLDWLEFWNMQSSSQLNLHHIAPPFVEVIEILCTLHNLNTVIGHFWTHLYLAYFAHFTQWKFLTDFHLNHIVQSYYVLALLAPHLLFPTFCVFSEGGSRPSCITFPLVILHFTLAPFCAYCGNS